MVSGCEEMKKRHFKLLSTCHFLQLHMKDALIGQEVVILKTFINDLSPKFSAAGLFEVDQGVYPAFISALIVYFIIIVQFKAVNIA